MSERPAGPRTPMKLFLFAAMLLSALSPLTAEPARDAPSSRGVHGVVTNSAGAPVDGAVVRLKDTKSLEIRSFITQSGGVYRFSGLNGSVEYELQATFQGATSSSKTLSVFDSRKDPEINLKLKK